MQISGEVPAAERIALDMIEPGDVLFFGSKGARSKSAQVDDTGIDIGAGRFVHVSESGVALSRLDGWYLDRSRAPGGRSPRPV